MSQKRSYQQNCALAIALDLIGERWTLLIVRELLIAPRQFTQLLRNLPGLGTNLLTDRLAQLATSGIVIRETGKGHPVYRLAEKGRQLEGVIFNLIHWGMSYTERRNAEQYHADEWDLLPLRSVFNPVFGRRWPGCYRFCMSDSKLHLECVDDQLVLAQQQSPVVAEIHLSSTTAIAMFNGELSWRDALLSGSIDWVGEQADVELFLSTFDPQAQ